MYQSVNNQIDYMQKGGISPTTVFGHRLKIVKLKRYLKLDEEDLEQAVSAKLVLRD